MSLGAVEYKWLNARMAQQARIAVTCSHKFVWHLVRLKYRQWLNPLKIKDVNLNLPFYNWTIWQISSRLQVEMWISGPFFDKRCEERGCTTHKCSQLQSNSGAGHLLAIRSVWELGSFSHRVVVRGILWCCRKTVGWCILQCYRKKVEGSIERCYRKTVEAFQGATVRQGKEAFFGLTVRQWR
jgi:hypothetical protein